MLICENDATDTPRSTKSRVGSSLRRLHQHVVQTRTVETQLDRQFEIWQEKWSSRREQIAERLATIDAQLQQLVVSNRQRPQLSLVAD